MADEPDQGDTSQGNPAWNEFLAFVPQEQHSQAQEVLKKWDSGVNDRFAARAKELEPYKPILDKKVDPQTLQQGLEIIEALQNRPDEYFKSLAQALGDDQVRQLLDLESTTAPGSPEENEELENLSKLLESHPDFKAIKDQLNSIATVVVGQREQSEIASQQEQVAAEIQTQEDAYKEKYHRDLDNFEMEQVITFMLQNEGASAETAFNALIEYQKRQGLISDKMPAPTVISPGGGNPNMPFDPSKLSDSEREKSAVDYLRQMNAENRKNS